MEQKRPGRRAYFLIALFAFLLVLFPFLFWYLTWFGRKLPDREIDEYLNNAAAKPRQAQHALVQIGERLSRGDRAAQRWYPNVIEASSSPALELRQSAAWIMGQDHSYEPFHAALRNLLSDPSPMVRRNAALSLSNFHDTAALPELRAIGNSQRPDFTRQLRANLGVPHTRDQRAGIHVLALLQPERHAAGSGR